MASSSFEEVDVKRLGTEMGVEITSNTDLVKAIKVGQSYLPNVGSSSGKKG